MKTVVIDKWFFSTNFIESFISEDLERDIRHELQHLGDYQLNPIWFYTLIGTVKREAKRQSDEGTRSNLSHTRR